MDSETEEHAMSPKELIAATIAENYLMFGVADDGEADKVAERVMEVLAAFQFEIVQRRNMVPFVPHQPT